MIARCRGWGWGREMVEGDQKGQTYKVSKFWGCTIQHDDYR